MLVGHVVHHHVQGQQHVALAKLARQFAQVVERADALVDVAVVADGITTITCAWWALQDGHHVQQIDAEFLQVTEPPAQTLQITCKGVGVQCHAHPFLAEEPVMVLFTLDVEPLQLRLALDVLQGHDLGQSQHLLFEVIAFAVKLVKQGMDGIEIGPEPSIEMAQIAPADLGFEPVKDAVQQ